VELLEASCCGPKQLPMPCEVERCPGAVFAVWGQPTQADVVRVHEELKRAAHEAGHPIVYITRVPADAPAPDEELRNFLSAHLPTMTQSCSSYHVIMEGDGFVAALKRAVLTSLLQPIWKKKMFYVHARAEDVLPSLSGPGRTAAERVLHRADVLGHLSCAAPSSEPSRTTTTL
jgi:hypothetical protein